MFSYFFPFFSRNFHETFTQTSIIFLKVFLNLANFQLLTVVLLYAAHSCKIHIHTQREIMTIQNDISSALEDNVDRLTQSSTERVDHLERVNHVAAPPRRNDSRHEEALERTDAGRKWVLSSTTTT